MTKETKNVDTPFSEFVKYLQMAQQNREIWENGSYKNANTELYKILWECFNTVQKFYALEGSVQIELRKELLKHTNDMAMIVNDVDFKENKAAGIVEIVRNYVFVGANISKHQKSDYKRVIEIAMNAKHEKGKWDKNYKAQGRETVEEMTWKEVDERGFTTWITQGIHNITRNISDAPKNETKLEDIQANLMTLSDDVFYKVKDTFLDGNVNAGFAVMLVNFSSTEQFTIVPVVDQSPKTVNSVVRAINKIAEDSEQLNAIMKPETQLSLDEKQKENEAQISRLRKQGKGETIIVSEILNDEYLKANIPNATDLAPV